MARAPQALPAGPPPRASAWHGALFLPLAFLVYGGALGHAYVLDGALLLERNPLLEPFEPWRIAQLDWWEGSGRPGGLYRPVALVALVGLRALAGGAPALVNAANVALLGAVAWLAFAFLARLLGAGTEHGARPWPRAVAWGAAFCVLVHPLNAELAGAQVGLADLLAVACALGAVLVASGGGAARAGAARLALAALLACLAALSKETGVLVVPLAILFELCRAAPGDERAGRARACLRALAWSLAGVGAALACRLAAIGTLASADDPVYAGFAPLARAASACATLAATTLPACFAPWRQLAVVGSGDAPPAAGFGDPRALAGALVLLALCVLPWLALRRGRRALAFAGWWFLAAWLPTSNLLFSSGAVAASRFLFPGLLGLGLALALLARRLLAGSASAAAPRAGPVARAAGAALVATCALSLPVLAWRETACWRTQRTLLEAQVARSPRAAYARVDLATLIQAEDAPRAERLFDEAGSQPLPRVPGTELPPEDALETAFLARAGAALLAERRGDLDRALERGRAAAELAETGRRAAARLPFREDWTRHRAGALQRLVAVGLARAKPLAGEARAAAHAELARDLDALDALLVARDAGSGAAWIDSAAGENVRLRALLLDQRGDPAGRARLVEQAWRARPGDPLLRYLWAQELRRAGRAAEALALELDVAESTFEDFDRARSLAIARAGLASGDLGLAARARALLERLARVDAAAARWPEVTRDAQRLLAELGPAAR